VDRLDDVAAVAVLAPPNIGQDMLDVPLLVRLLLAAEAMLDHGGDSLAAATSEPLAMRLARQRRRDAAAGRSLSGPHRHDLAVTHVAKGQAAALCSTGEQKALLLSILLAHAALVADERGQPPVLLLDEVAAHLDPLRRAALFDRLAETGGQIWMTGTEPSLFSDLTAATRLTVTAGHVFRSTT
jgi:DNA replication and repair protein RecF